MKYSMVNLMVNMNCLNSKWINFINKLHCLEIMCEKQQQDFFAYNYPYVTNYDDLNLNIQIPFSHTHQISPYYNYFSIRLLPHQW